jgi:adenylosuccinate synthase
VTGRPRRTGWLDLPALRYAARVNGLDGLAVTKLDVLTGLSSLEVCVAYETEAGRTSDFPVDHLDRARPVYETLPGWNDQLPAVRNVDELPRAAREYVRFLEQGAGVPAFVVSVGPRRDETIILRHAFA